MKTKINTGKKIKVIVLLTLFVIIPALLFIGMFVPFYKDIPDSYKSSFHSYNEALVYARTIDPDAEVEKKHEDIKERYSSRRVWHAKINGTECDVLSLSHTFYGDVLIQTILSFETLYPKDYYGMRTDYFDSEIPEIVGRYPELGELEDVTYGSISSRMEFDEITTDKFNEIWNAYTNVLDEIHRYNPYVTFTIRCKLENDGKLVDEYYIFEPTEDEYKNVYNDIVIDNVLKNHSYRTGCSKADNPEDIWTSAEYTTDPSDERRITPEKLKNLWEEYKTVDSELRKETSFINSHTLQIRLTGKKEGYTYSHVVGYYEFTDTDEKTYERVCKEMEEYLY